jgi:hypothetical protein
VGGTPVRAGEFRAIDDERVLMLSTEHFRGRDGIEISQPQGVEVFGAA